MTRIYKLLFLLVLGVCSSPLSAQTTNIFHDRAFWKTNPDVAKVEEEIKKGNDATELNRSGFDATVLAINENVPAATIKYLLDLKGNDVNKITHDSRNYLHWAAIRGNTEIMEYVLSKGAKTDQEDSHGMTPLNFAAGAGQSNTKVYDLLLANGVTLKAVDPNGANALLLAAPSDKDFALTNYFVSKGLDLKSTDSNGNTVFNYVARTGNIELMKSLLAKGVTFNDQAMIFASMGSRGGANKKEVYVYLESLGIKPTAVSKDGNTALHYIARREKDIEVINYFLDKGVDINQANNEGNTAFMNAATSNTPEILTALLPKVKNINVVNKKGASALALAVQYNTPEVVQLLIDKKANVAIIDANGDNLMAYLIPTYNAQNAAAFETKLRALQKGKLAVTAPQKNGNTLYHLALDKNDISLLKRVNELKADVNVKNKEGISPLHKAAMIAKDDEILKYLISIGAKKDAVTDFKETAYSLASENELLTKSNVSIDFLK